MTSKRAANLDQALGTKDADFVVYWAVKVNVTAIGMVMMSCG